MFEKEIKSKSVDRKDKKFNGERKQRPIGITGFDWFFRRRDLYGTYLNSGRLKIDMEFNEYENGFYTARALAKEAYKLDSRPGWNFMKVTLHSGLVLGVPYYYDKKKDCICLPIYNDSAELGSRYPKNERNLMYGKDLNSKFARTYFKHWKSVEKIRDRKEIDVINKSYTAKEFFEGVTFEGKDKYTLINFDREVKE